MPNYKKWPVEKIKEEIDRIREKITLSHPTEKEHKRLQRQLNRLYKALEKVQTRPERRERRKERWSKVGQVFQAILTLGASLIGSGMIRVNSNKQTKNMEIKLFDIGKALGEIVTSGINIDADGNGKIDGFESFNFIQIAVMRIVAHYGSVGEAIAALKEVEERQHLVNGLAEGFDIDNDVLEQLVEDTVSAINELSGLGQDWVEFFATRKQAA